MAKRLKDLIEAELEQLVEESLKKFKRRLNEADLEAGYSRIPLGKLQRADAMDIADSIVNYYREDYGQRLTIRILEEINEKPSADRLREGTGGGAASGSSMPPATNGKGGASARPAPKEQHFVDRHREAIITRTSLVGPIVDRLYSQGLTREQYNVILSKDTSENKMRALHGFVTDWGRAGKDRLYEALKAENGLLIEDLGGQ